jgi:hypothetical protein
MAYGLTKQAGEHDRPSRAFSLERLFIETGTGWWPVACVDEAFAEDDIR